jgi:hypothetical protein
MLPRVVILLVAITIISLSGCATYNATPAPMPEVEKMPIRYTLGRVMLGADPFLEEARQRAMFDSNFSGAGVLAIQLLVANEGEGKVRVRRTDIALELPDGSVLQQAEKTVVVYVAGGEIPKLAPNPLAAPLVVAPAIGIPAGPLAGAVAAVSLAQLAELIAANARLGAMLENIRRKEFQDATLSIGESNHGFVYFFLPAGTERATLAIPVWDTEEATITVGRLLLSNLATIGEQPKNPSGSEATEQQK